MEKLYHIDVTRRNISEALLELMKKKDFSTISITEIAEEAGVGRATFYRNFGNKEAVLRYYFDMVIKRFKIPVEYVSSTDEAYYGAIMYILRAVEKNKRLIKRVLDANLSLVVVDYIEDQYKRLFEAAGKQCSPFVPSLYAGAAFNLGRKWISEDCAADVHEVADAIFIASVGRRLNKSTENDENANKD